MQDLNFLTFLATILYGALGFFIFMISLWAMEKLTPFSLEKKVTEEGNIAVAIVIASVILALGIIYSAVIN